MKIRIHVYTSFRTSSHMYIKGRLLKNDPIISRESQSIFSSLFQTIMRAMSREVPDVPMIISIGESRYEVITDDEGYFEIFETIQDQIFNDYKVRIEAIVKDVKVKVESNLVSIQNCKSIGIISDIDDTVLVTGVKSFFKIRLIINTLFINPFRRRPIQDSRAAFHKLSSDGPVIYLSNSPWNLFYYLNTFLNHYNFPKGILILRDMSWKALRKKSISKMNKFHEIERLLIAFSNTNFILIGDTGEFDYDIYTAIHKKYPKRILKIIMNIAGNVAQENKIRNDIDSKNQGIEIRLVDGYEELL